MARKTIASLETRIAELETQVAQLEADKESARIWMAEAHAKLSAPKAAARPTFDREAEDKRLAGVRARMAAAKEQAMKTGKYVDC